MAALDASFTIRIDETTDAQAARAEIRCAQCGRVVLPVEGVYALRVTIAPDGESIRGTVTAAETVAGGEPRWSFASGAELAQLVRRLGHSHADEATAQG